MSEELQINISDWVNQAKKNPEKYSTRQVIEILMHAVGMTRFLKGNMFLKGGALMALAYHSERMTGDVDYSWLEPFDNKNDRTIDQVIKESLEGALQKARVKLGYLDILCKVQSMEKMPNKWKKDELSFPGLRVKIGYAYKGTSQEENLKKGTSSQTLSIDISFNEKIGHSQELLLDDTDLSVNAYTTIDIIAEKLRALLQQTQRSNMRNRRQDIYDINLLLQQFDLDDDEKSNVLKTLKTKSESRNVVVNRESLSDSRVKEAAQKEWDSIQLELDEELPDFEQCYSNVKAFYESLPW